MECHGCGSRQVDTLLGARPPGVPPLLLAWLVVLCALSGVDVMDAYVTAGYVNMAIRLPAQANYLVCFLMEAMFADDAHCIFLRFRVLNERLEATCRDLARRHPCHREHRVETHVHLYTMHTG